MQAPCRALKPHISSQADTFLFMGTSEAHKLCPTLRTPQNIPSLGRVPEKYVSTIEALILLPPLIHKHNQMARSQWLLSEW